MPRALSPRLLALGLAVASVLAYAPSLGNGFVNYDDDLYITNRPEVRAGVSREGVVWAFTSTQGANWFPLTRLSWMLDAQLFGVNAVAYHATSLALHVAAALLLFAALRRLTGHDLASAFVAGVFALHPLHVESVAWASARKDVLSGLCFALALLVYERLARGRRRLVDAALLALAMAAGLLAKPMLVTLPFVLLLLDAWPLGRLRAHPGRALLEKLPLFALAALASAATLAAQDAGGALQGLERYPLAGRLANAVNAPLFYLEKAVWPVGLAPFYPYPHGGLGWERVAVAAGFFLFVSVAGWRLRRRAPYVLVGWLWFVGMLVPVSGIVQVGQAAQADRYTYLPLIGPSLAVAFAGVDLARRWPDLGRPLVALAAAALLALAGASFLQVRHWHDSGTLFEHALAVTERNHVAHINLAEGLARGDRFAPAEQHLTRALAIAPRSAVALGMRGEVRAGQGDLEAAERDLRSALRLEPDSPRWLAALGGVLAEAGRTREALPLLERAAALDPDGTRSHVLLGATFQRLGRNEEAIDSYRTALSVETRHSRLPAPGLAAVHAQLGSLLAVVGEREEALHHLGESIRLDPEAPAPRAARAGLFEALGRERDAVADYRVALELGDRSTRVLNNLAWLLARARQPGLRDPERAVALASEAVRQSDADDPSVLDTLAVAQAAAGRPAESRATTVRALALAEARGDTALATSLRARLR